MRRLTLVLGVTLAALLSAAVENAHAASGALIAESSRLIALGEVDTAWRILHDIYTRSASEEDRFDAARLLASFPAGSQAFKDRETYARFVLNHPLAKERLPETDRRILLRTEALGLFSAGNWTAARAAFQELARSANPDDRGIALLHEGWIDINAKKPEAAVLHWLAALESGGIGENWITSILRDLGRAWAESGGVSANVATRLEQVVAAAPDAGSFQEGLSSGLVRISGDAALLKNLRAVTPQGMLRRRAISALIENASLRSAVPCEVLAWLDLSDVADPAFAAQSEGLKSGLKTCWLQSGGTLAPAGRVLLLDLLTGLMNKSANPDEKLLLAQIGEGAGEWDRACANYVGYLSEVEAPVSLDHAESVCRKISKPVATDLRSRLLIGPEKSLGIADAIFSVEKDAVARQAVLEAKFSDPLTAGALTDKRPVLWWLDALSSTGPIPVNPELRMLWSMAFLEKPELWKGLPLDAAQRLLLKLEISRSAGAFEPLHRDLAELELEARKSPKLRAAYIQWLEQYASLSLQNPAPGLPTARKGWICRPWFAALSILTGPEKEPAQRLDVIAGESSQFLKGAAIFMSARMKLRQAQAIRLDLASPSFPAKLQRKLSLLQAGAALLGKAAEKIPQTRERATQLLRSSASLIQDGIARLEAPARWPEREKQLWVEQRVLLARQLEGAVQL